jgi:hypothetical protein
MKHLEIKLQVFFINCF